MIVFNSHRWPLGLLIALPLGLVLLASGCGPREEIRTYPVAKEVQVSAAETQAPPQNSEPTDRMLGAILPAENGAWFFKAVGPIAQVDKRADSITEFFNSIRLKPGAAKPEWKLPEGWTEGGPRPMRVATLMIPMDGKPIELAVSSAAGSMLSNVNRWRGQMKLPNVDEKGLAESTREVKVGDATMTLVDLRGRFDPGMMAPFAGGAAGATGRAAPNEPASLPAGHPPVDGAGPATRDRAANAAAPETPKFEAPTSWESLPAGEIRKAAFAITDGDKKALVTVIDFRADAGPMIADPLQNVNQWRQAVGLAPIEKDSLANVTESIEIDGKPATYARILSDPAKAEESKVEMATLAAMVADGERIWFFKMIGDRELVAAQEDEFKSFLKSVRFAGDGGARDGD